MKCQDIRDRLPEYCREEIEDGMREKLESHLAGCEPCAEAYAAEARLMQAVRLAAGEELEPNPYAWEDFCRRVETSRRSRPAFRWTGIAAPLAAAASLAIFLWHVSLAPPENVTLARIPEDVITGPAAGPEPLIKTIKNTPRPSIKPAPPAGLKRKPRPAKVKSSKEKPVTQKPAPRKRLRMMPRPKMMPQIMLTQNTDPAKKRGAVSRARQVSGRPQPVFVRSEQYVLPQVQPEGEAPGVESRLVIRQVAPSSIVQASYTY